MKHLPQNYFWLLKCVNNCWSKPIIYKYGTCTAILDHNTNNDIIVAPEA